jgi:limonene-1,2-epoxide hydrolase
VLKFQFFVLSTSAAFLIHGIMIATVREDNPRADGERISMDQLTAARIQTVRDHMRLECEGDWDGVIATFDHPRYELYGAGTVFDGEDEVRGYFAASRTPFPDQANEIIAIGAGGDTVLVEFWLTGTHLGPLRTPKGEIAPTSKAFRVRMMASFEFAVGSDKIVCERPYFDQRAVIRALGLS